MNIFGNYILHEELYRGASFVIYKGLDQAKNLPVIIKKQTVPGNHGLEQEYQVILDLNHEKISKPIDFINIEEQNAIVFKDSNKIILSKFIRKNPVDLSLFFNIAIQLVEIIGYVHTKQYVHKDIKPGNIIIDPKTAEINLIDFNLVSKIKYQAQRAVNPQKIEGTFHYMSPEQTGRMKQRYDHRTDIYSMGVLFFEMLTGELPYDADDAMGIIYAIISKNPKNLKKLNPHIPEILIRIIMTCIEKQPDDRYQSAYGLLYDLKKCKELYKSKRFTNDFEIKTHDSVVDFDIPQKIYGRKVEIEILLKAFNKIQKQEVTFISLSGYAGIGKTRLVYEIQKPIAKRKSIFVTGKFEQLFRNEPYLAWKNALKQLVDHILSMEQVDFAVWAKRISEKLYPNAQVLIDFIPEFEKIIGSQPKITQLGDEQSKNRLYYVIYKLIQLFSRKKYPLVIFIDDWQWADQASLNLLQEIVAKYRPHYLMMICAYRSNEVDETHPFRMILNTINTSVKNTHMQLNPLTITDVKQLIKDIFQERINHITELANLCFTKSQGNPFYLIQFIESLYDDNYIYFNFKENIWVCDIEAIRKKQIHKDIIQLMLSRLKRLTLNEREVLEAGSCIGSKFDLFTIAWSIQIPNESVFQNLISSIQLGYISPLDQKDEIYVEGKNLYFSFNHDKLQQAAYSSIEESKRINLTYQIAIYLFKKNSFNGFKKDIFKITNQFNKSRSILSTDKEKLQLMYLNYHAARQAMASIAYKIAFNYFMNVMELLPKNIWRTRYHFAKAVYLSASKTATLYGDFETADYYCNQGIENAISNEDKMLFLIRQTNLKFAQKKPAEAVRAMFLGLTYVDIVAVQNVSLLSVGIEILKLKWLIKRLGREGLKNLPPAKDIKIYYATELIAASLSSLYATLNKNQIAYIGAIILKKIIVNGKTLLSGSIFMSIAILFLFVKDIKAAKTMAEVAIYHAENSKNRASYVNVNMLYANFVLPWYENIYICLERLLNNYAESINIGDHEMAGFSALRYCALAKYSGMPFDLVLEKMNMLYLKTSKIKQDAVINMMKLELQLIDNLVNVKQHPTIFTGPYFHEIHDTDKEDEILIDRISYYKTSICCYFNDYQQACFSAKKCNLWQGQRHPGSIENVRGCFTTSLAIFCFLLNHQESSNTKEFYKVGKKLFIQIKKSLKLGEINTLHLFLLIKALFYWYHGKHKKVSKIFDLAEEHAKSHKFYFDLALIYEYYSLFTHFILQKEKSDILFLKAKYYFEKIGAVAKAKQLESVYAKRLEHLSLLINFKPMLPSLNKISMDSSTGTISMPLDSNLIRAFELSTLNKVSFAMSTETQFERLIVTVLKNINENIGANRVILLLQKNNFLYAEGEINDQDEIRNILKSVPYYDYENMPYKLIDYVARKKQPVIFQKTDLDLRFSDDPYLNSAKPKAILAFPIIMQDKLLGMFYFENTALEINFSQAHLQILNMLVSQIAISIENVRLYSSLERFVPKEMLNLLKKRSIIEVEQGDAVKMQMTILYIDIRNFTTLAEEKEELEVFGLLNTYLNILAPCIRAHHGFIDTYIGDATLALFPGAADDAIKAGIEMRKALRDLNESRAKENLTQLNMGFGIHSGVAMLGTIGTKSRLDSTVISDAVNTTARIESLHKFYRSALLTTQATVDLMKDHGQLSLRLIDKVLVKGKTKPLILWEVLDAESEIVRNDKVGASNLYLSAWYAYQSKEFERAIVILTDLLKMYPLDHIAAILLDRCKNFVKNPPKPEWCGEFQVFH